MSGYCSIFPTFWTQGSGKDLRGKKDGQIVSLYLMSCPARNMVGLFYLPLVTACHESGLTRDEFLCGLREASDIAQYDLERELVWVPKAAQYQVGRKLSAGDKRRPLVFRLANQYLPHRFAYDFFRLYGQAYGLAIPGGVAPEEGPGRGIDAPSVSVGKVVVARGIDAPSMPLSTATATVECMDQGEGCRGEGDSVVRLVDWKPSESARRKALGSGYHDWAIDKSSSDMRGKFGGFPDRQGLQSDWDRRWETQWLVNERLGPKASNGGNCASSESTEPRGLPGASEGSPQPEAAPNPSQQYGPRGAGPRHQRALERTRRILLGNSS